MTEKNYDTESIFMGACAIIQERVHANARAKGFWKDHVDGKLTVDQVGLKLALIHSEISEALESVRNDYPASEKIPEIGNFEEELADAAIRIMDLAESSGVDLGEAIVKKMEFNVGRPHMHGGKKA